MSVCPDIVVWWCVIIWYWHSYITCHQVVFWVVQRLTSWPKYVSIAGMRDGNINLAKGRLSWISSVELGLRKSIKLYCRAAIWWQIVLTCDWEFSLGGHTIQWDATFRKESKLAVEPKLLPAAVTLLVWGGGGGGAHHRVVLAGVQFSVR